ncbi:class II fructose-bisphosphatase [Maritalea porphyrae]|jgi:fructose-1,6-bisphosphatase II / sedoheptulose-1,7-bisphosphatase|uniref:class II fructose-bisphosphatase n=1 Tax=Maritalea porphyrae TaxID=880732 RepID=UPI0022AE7A16|nr:class II fructose-bisphosphatase [Maritalea porphyrae]MCZ4270795.1 class II fructose-bisphosphatase [Maritalea porphyrae]
MTTTAKSALSEPAIVDRNLTLEIVRVTENAAIAAADWRGKGDEKSADRAAVEAMREELGKVTVDGRVVIGEGERDEAPMLFIGEEVGLGTGAKVDIAVDPLEGTTLCAKNQHDSLAVLAMAERGGLLHAPDVYMDKIAVGPGFEPGIVQLDRSVTENVNAIAKARGVKPSEVTVCVLDRPRHAKIIDELREIGASIKLINDGDIAGVIHTTDREETGIDMYVGTGGAPEGVLAAAALRCVGGQMQARLVLDTAEKRERAARLGIEDPERVYEVNDLASGDVLFAATGVTDGSLLDGVKIRPNYFETSTLVMRSWSKTVRWIKARHVRDI